MPSVGEVRTTSATLMAGNSGRRSPTVFWREPSEGCARRFALEPVPADDKVGGKLGAIAPLGRHRSHMLRTTASMPSKQSICIAVGWPLTGTAFFDKNLQMFSNRLVRCKSQS